MGLKILVVDPDNKFILGCKDFLEKNMFECSIAQNGKDAQILCSQNKYFAVMANLAIQNYNIFQVLKFIKSNQSSGQIICHNASKNILDELKLDKEKLVKLGVNELIDHMPTIEEVKNALEGHQSIQDIVSALPKKEGLSAEEEVAGDDEKFTAIRIEDFYSSKNVIFDVFVKLGAKKYLKFLHAGDAFAKERLDRYKNDKNVQFLYISTVDRKKFIQWNNLVLEKTLDSKKVGAESKVKILRSVSEKYIEELYTEGLKPQLIEQGKTICQNTFKLIEKEKDLYKILRGYQELDPGAFSHFFLIGLFSGMIVKFFDWQSQTTTDTLTMAAMLHDIGKTKLPSQIITKRVPDLSPQELDFYKEHVQHSMILLEGNRLVSSSVKQVILQHHEASDGSGFPSGHKDSSISALSKILFFVNEFVDLITHEKLTPVQGVVKVLKDPACYKRYNRFVVENFIKVFMDPEKIEKGRALPPNSSLAPIKKAQ